MTTARTERKARGTRRRTDEPAEDGDLARLERKLDRLTGLVAVLLVTQIVVLTAVVTPDEFFGVVAAALFAAILGVAALAAFPGLRSRVPWAMRQVGRGVGRVRRWLHLTA